jgi:hypothetical protein
LYNQSFLISQYSILIINANQNLDLELKLKEAQEKIRALEKNKENIE